MSPPAPVDAAAKAEANRQHRPGIDPVRQPTRLTPVADDVRYFIVSRTLSGPRFARAVRGHWGIENSRHWGLDVTFDEDQSRTRNRHMANNLSWLRRFAIHLLKRHPSTDRIKGKRERAGWSNDFLMQVLVAQRA